MALASGTRLGPYEILSALGAGGMGEVYRARDPRLGREIAIKVLPADVSSDPARRKRFEKEARSASALNHPNIVTIYDIGQSETISYIAMELVGGKTLREALFAGPLPIKRSLHIAVQVAEGLARAHEAGIVHRDLKPENLMVTSDGRVKILDFGLARPGPVGAGTGEGTDLPTETGTSAGVVLGTVGYMSPEQASGQPADFRSDQFSFGSILYEMLAGERAFRRMSAAETMSAIIREDPKPVEQLQPNVPPPLRWIVDRCLAKGPEERYASTRDLARDLAVVRDRVSEIGGFEPVPGGPPPRGRRRLVLAGALLLAAGILTGWAMSWLGPRQPPAPFFRRLTFQRGTIGNARFALDGQAVIYGASWASEPHRQLYLTRPESPESLPFDLGEADILSVSRSGQLAILQKETTKPTLALVPLAGGAPRPLLEGVGYAAADWSPDGKQLAVVHTVPGAPRRLEFPIGNVLVEGAVGAPRISPRSDRVAFVTEDERGFGVAVVDATGKAKTVLSSGWARVEGTPCWARRGGEIWFTARQEGEPAALYAVDLSGSRRLLLRVPGHLELDDVSPDGRVLVAHHTLVRHLMGLPPGESKERDLSWLNDSIVSDLSSDGRTLLITEVGEASGPSHAVYLRKTNGSPAVRLGEGTGLALSPDGAWALTLLAPIGAVPHLVLLPTGPGQPRQLENDRFEKFGFADWFADGKRILFSARERGRGSRLYVRDLESGANRPVSPEGVSLLRRGSPVKSLSPDGQYALGLQAVGNGAGLYPVEGGEARAIAGLRHPEEFPTQWSPDGQALFVYDRAEVPRRVFLLDPKTGARRLWKEFPSVEPHDLSFRVLIASDGQSYVYGFVRALSALYVVEGLK